MINNILKYWYKQEFFIPCWPIRRGDCDLTKNNPPWFVPQTDPKKFNSYDVYFGKITVCDLTEWLLRKLNLSFDAEEIEKDISITCLFAMKIDESGRYVAESFAISSLVWAICELAAASSFSHELDHIAFDRLQKKIDEEIIKRCEEAKNSSISNEFLEELFCYVCDQVRFPDEFRQFTAWSRRKTVYANKNDEFPPINPATELIQSFYFSDIKRVQGGLTERLQRYISAMSENDQHDGRIHIDRDTEQMQHWLAAEAYPLGAWPSPYSPSLMQQLGINLAISDAQTVFSVNGPPGTGKTTLLKEIIASNIIQRAIVLAGYANPGDAFQKVDFEDPIDEYNKCFYKMNDSLSVFGMIVASNNNVAVENISVELPKAIKKDRTGHFSAASTEQVEDTYFADIATKLLGEPAWGLISARLGKKDNLNCLKERLWWAKDHVTLKRYYEDERPSWTEACRAFETALAAVQQTRDRIAKAQSSLTTLYEAEKNLRLAQTVEEGASELYIQQEKDVERNEQELNQLRTSQQAEIANAARLKTRIPFIKQIFRRLYKKNPMIMEWEDIIKRIDRLEIEIVHQQRKCSDAQNRKASAENQRNLLIEETKQAQKIRDEAQKSVAIYCKEFGDGWTDADFWRNISENEKSQSSSPWTTPEYDKLREELFFQALMLHKAFILSSNEVKQNLNRLFSIWDGKITGIDRSNAYSHLLNTLMLVIPVISTTFASVQRFLDGIGAEQLGVLIVDEAGQATPQSALGAMWRTRKAIIVGDPLQVEPIVSIPGELRKRLADEYTIPQNYRLPGTSVQVLADSINLYGGNRKSGDTVLWLGCPLVTHRRCIDPMFRISNEVAYDNRMFNETLPPDPKTKFLLQKSVWFDCSGPEKGQKNHAVQQQIDLAVELFERALGIFNGLPDLYLISPFTTVAQELFDAFEKSIAQKFPKLENAEIVDWTKRHCGTVHTFQGKEASEVLFVLGCDAQSGRGAARWVGNKPNIVNVAVSRAKYRIGVIGDYTLWKNIPYVQNICNYLDRTTDFDSAINLV